MRERSEMIGWIRAEIVGPSPPAEEPVIADFEERVYHETLPERRGPLFWRPAESSELQEVLYFYQESPYRKYGAGLLHPVPLFSGITDDEEVRVHETQDRLGFDSDAEDIEDDNTTTSDRKDDDSDFFQDSDDFDVSSPDIRRPTTMGISVFVKLDRESGEVLISLPKGRHFPWQSEGSAEFQLNGRYERCKRQWKESGTEAVKSSIAWRRISVGGKDKTARLSTSDLQHGKVIRAEMPENNLNKIKLCFEVFPRKIEGSGNWLLTIVLRNNTEPENSSDAKESTLYQTYFEVSVKNGNFQKYPESQRPFEQLDEEEQSLALLYQENSIWGIGHGCSAGWDTEPSEEPVVVYADVLPAVQLPSMTPDIEVDGEKVSLTMRSLVNLAEDGKGEGWESIHKLLSGFRNWIEENRNKATNQLSENLQTVAERHLSKCDECLDRMTKGVKFLQHDRNAREAFRLANLAILLQQIATKQIKKRSLVWDSNRRNISLEKEHSSPWSIYADNTEDTLKLGNWRAFQIAFLLMSIQGIIDGKSPDREIVDLVWFPTGGGKTEAYLGVMAFYMFHQRLLEKESSPDDKKRDGTNVIMRYTLRMLTTQQFQRAASMVCAMEYMRRNHDSCGLQIIPGRPFSLGLWIGGDGSPNTIDKAKAEIKKFQRGDEEGNPLVLTECPWCRAQIGRYDGKKPNTTPRIPDSKWNAMRTRGIVKDTPEGPLLRCPDSNCEYGQEDLDTCLPIEVIDERIYRFPPSLIVSTADKLAMIAYRPASTSLFGRSFSNGNLVEESYPPGLIIQDELHLISGPLGTMYALYEGVIERLCSYEHNGTLIKPKIVASTATIRGASEQVKSLYNRDHVQLFPSPGLEMGDSFFGVYARDNGRLMDGRLYLGILAGDYGSILTAQVRAFSAALFLPWIFESDKRDPWWTILAFYNSIRELGGAKTLFDSDIRSRLKYLFNREGHPHDKRRNLQIVDELTSRLSQAEIVSMMDRLAVPYEQNTGKGTIDACLASNIIEVGVDIDRLSLMGVVGQPKTTATYIQVTGRVGRRWTERPGLILMMYSPSKSRDRSHYEQFHSYHRRLYERVEPTSATPFAVSAIQRGFAGTLLSWLRQKIGPDAPVQNLMAYKPIIEECFSFLKERCESVQNTADAIHSVRELEMVRTELIEKWKRNPQKWEEYPHDMDGEYLMLWPGQFKTAVQRQIGVEVPSSMRQVDGNAELTITQGYILEEESGEGDI